MSNSTQIPDCPRCELDRLTAEYIANMDSYVSNIPSESTVDSDIYALRLKLCASCDANTAGLCGYCGCFVRIRAAMKHMYCPAPVKLWQ